METKEKDVVINKLLEIYNQLSLEHNFKTEKIKIEISDRLRSVNGFCECVCSQRGAVSSSKITMSGPLFDEFGWERFERTFRHEVAHIADFYKRGKSKHDYHFKLICQKFGGSMSPKMAGHLFESCVSKEYVKTIKKYRYECPCGATIERAKRMKKTVRESPFHYCAKCRNPISKWKEIELF